MIPVMRPWLGAEEAAAAAEAVSSGWVAEGPRVAEFEQAFASTIGAGHAVAVSSWTAALHLALSSPGSARVTRSSCPPSPSSRPPTWRGDVGAVPVFVDVDEATQNLDACHGPTVPGASHLLVVILVDQAGVPADLDAMQALCEPRQITVVEDAACAVGFDEGRPVGARCRAGCVLLLPAEAAHHRRRRDARDAEVAMSLTGCAVSASTGWISARRHATPATNQ